MAAWPRSVVHYHVPVHATIPLADQPGAPALPVDPQTAVHAPPTATAAALVLIGLLAGFGTAAAAKTTDELKRATEAYAQGNFDEARDAYARALKADKPPPHAGRNALRARGRGPPAQGLRERRAIVQRGAGIAPTPDLQTRSLRGLGTSLYDLGDTRLRTGAGVRHQGLDGFARSFHGRAQGPEAAQQGEHAPNTRSSRRTATSCRSASMNSRSSRNNRSKARARSRRTSSSRRAARVTASPRKTRSPARIRTSSRRKAATEQKKEHDQLQKQQEQLPEGELNAKEGGQQPSEQQGQPQGGGVTTSATTRPGSHRRRRATSCATTPTTRSPRNISCAVSGRRAERITS